MRIKHSTLLLAAVICTMLILSGCFSTFSPKQTGEVPTAAMLPFTNAYEPEAADGAKNLLEACLREGNMFEFADQSRVGIAVAGINLDKPFGLQPSQSVAIARELGVDYVLHGTVALRRTSKPSGWLYAVVVSVRIYDGKTGNELDSWSSMTDSAVQKSSLDFFAKEMAETAAGDVCAKMLAGTH